MKSKIEIEEIVYSELSVKIVGEKSTIEEFHIKEKNQKLVFTPNATNCSKYLKEYNIFLSDILNLTKKYSKLEFRVVNENNIYNIENIPRYIERFVLKNSEPIFIERFIIEEDISSCITCGCNDENYMYDVDYDPSSNSYNSTPKSLNDFDSLPIPSILNKCKSCRCGEDIEFKKI